MKAIIIDDEPLAREVIKEYLRNYPAIALADECGDGFEGVKAIVKHHPDIIFLDIQMPKITGFEMLELLDEQPMVIFTTAFDEYAVKAFEAQAIDYLLKPFSRERFDKAVQKCLSAGKENNNMAVTYSQEKIIQQQPESSSRIVVKSGSNIIVLPVKDVLYFEAYDDYIKIYTQDKMYLKKKTMAYFEQTLNNKQFVRVHRSFMVQLSSISAIEPMEKESYVLKLKNNARIPVSRAGYKKLKELLN